MSKHRLLHIFISHPSQFMTDCKPHGDGLLAFHYIEKLGRRGHQLYVAVPLMSVQQQLPSNIHLYPVSSFTQTSGGHPPSLNRLEYAVRVRQLLLRLKRQFPIDLIHQLNPVVPGMSLFLSGCGLPIVLGPLPPYNPEQLLNGPAAEIAPRAWSMAHSIRDMILHRQLRDAALILIPTVKSLDIVPEDPAIRQKVRTLNYGVDAEAFQPAPGLETPQMSILFLANLVPRKGLLLLIEAFERIAGRHPHCTLRIAGDGYERDAIMERVASSPVAARIEMLGKVAPEAVPALLGSCTLYCLPSYSEPFGMTALEAMSCGKPVIGTRSGGLGALLDEQGARRITPGSVDDLEQALDEMLASPALRASMGRHNRRRVVEEFSWDVVIDRLEGFYNTVLEGRGAESLARQEMVPS